MLEQQFEELQKLYGTRLVYKDDQHGYNFVMGDKLCDMDEKETEEYERIEKLIEGENGNDKIEGIVWWLGYGDDWINCVSLKSLDLFDQVEGLEQFVRKYLGENCYIREDE